jgi:hypothetical protein
VNIKKNILSFENFRQRGILLSTLIKMWVYSYVACGILGAKTSAKFDAICSFAKKFLV